MTGLPADHAEPGSRGPQSDSPTSDAYAPAYNASFYTVRWGAVGSGGEWASERGYGMTGEGPGGRWTVCKLLR